MTRRDFIESSGFALISTQAGTHRHTPRPQPRSPRRPLLDALLAVLLGTALAAVLFFGWSGGFAA